LSETGGRLIVDTAVVGAQPGTDATPVAMVTKMWGILTQNWLERG